MAKFNPDVPNSNDPNYLGYSRPISQYEGDTSLGTALKGIGNVIETGAKGFDFAIKSNIEDQIYEAVDTERGAYTAALEDTKDKMTGKPLDLMKTAGDPVPAELENVGNYAASLKSARDANKISPTYYYGRLNAMAKELRTYYPGYRDYIDSKISSITGVNPANAYASSIVSDINQLATKSAQDIEHLKKWVRENPGLPGAPLMMQGIEQGYITNESQLVKWAYPQKKLQNDLALRAAERADMKGTREEIQAHAETTADMDASAHVANYFQNIQIAGELQTGKTIQQMVQDHRLGKKTISSEDSLKLADSILAQRDAAFNEKWAEWNKVNPKTGTSMVADLGGPEKAKARLNGHFEVFDQIGKALKDGKLDIAAAAMERVNAQVADSALQLYTQPNGVGTYLRMVTALNNKAPQYAQKFFETFITQADPNSLKVDKTLQLLFKEDAVRSSIDPKDVPDIRYKQPTFKESADRVKKVVEDKNLPPKQAALTLDQYIKLGEEIGSPDLPDDIKIQRMKTFFDPSSQQTIGEFGRDQWDPIEKRYIPGKFAVFNRLTSPAVTKEVFRLAESHPEGAKMAKQYIDLVENTFGKELFSNEIKDLKGISLHPDIKLTYNPETLQFQLVAKKNVNQKPNPNNIPMTASEAQLNLSPIDERSVQKAQETITRLNAGLSSVSNMADAAGIDKNAYLYKLFIGAGVEPGEGSVINQMSKAVVTGQRASKGTEAKPVTGTVEGYVPLRMYAEEGNTFSGWNRGDLMLTDIKSGVKLPSSSVDIQEITDKIPVEGRAFLDTLSGGEAPGYNVKYGGRTFTDYSQFPKGSAVIKGGPNAGKTSSASGRYQFLEGTWNQQAKKLGLTDFSPENQDMAAWDLAQTVYARQSKGRDLTADLRDPSRYGAIAKALSGTWTSLPGGIETNAVGKKFVRNLMQNLRKYQDKTPLPEFDEAGFGSTS